MRRRDIAAWIIAYALTLAWLAWLMTAEPEPRYRADAPPCDTEAVYRYMAARCMTPGPQP